MVTIPVDFEIQDAEKLKILSQSIANEIKGLINQPTIMGINDFARLNTVSRNNILAHREEFCVIKIGGKLVVNMIAWREKLQRG